MRVGLSIERVYSSPTSGDYKESIFELLKSSDHRQTPAAIWLEKRIKEGREESIMYVRSGRWQPNHPPLSMHDYGGAI